MSFWQLEKADKEYKSNFDFSEISTIWRFWQNINEYSHIVETFAGINKSLILISENVC